MIIVKTLMTTIRLFFYLNVHYCKINLTIGHLIITHYQNDNNRLV